MIITISGKPGSGKTTAAKGVAKALAYKFFSAGDFRGKIAVERGMTIDQLNELGKKEKWTDKIVDDEIIRIGKNEDNYVIDSWLGFFFIPKSVKIFLDIDEDEGARRVFNEQRHDEEKKDSIKEVKAMLNKRAEESQERFKKYYGIDHLEMKNYDKVIETTKMKKGDAAKEILKFVGSLAQDL